MVNVVVEVGKQLYCLFIVLSILHCKCSLVHMIFICFYRLRDEAELFFSVVNDSMPQTLNKSCVKPGTLFKEKHFTSDSTVTNKVKA